MNIRKNIVNCQTPINCLEDYLDGLLDTDLQNNMLNHIKQCPDCQDWIEREKQLRMALKTLPVTPPDKDFNDRIFKQAIKQNNRSTINHSIWMKLVASIILVVAISLGGKGIWDFSHHGGIEVFVAMNQKEDIQLMFRSEENLSNVTFSLILSEGVELVGFANQREIIWEGELDQGPNLLSLPVIVRHHKGGNLIAKITHDNGNKQFDLKINVKKESFKDDHSEIDYGNDILIKHI